MEQSKIIKKSKIDILISQLDTFKIPEEFIHSLQDLKAWYGIDVEQEIRYFIENEKNKKKI